MFQVNENDPVNNSDQIEPQKELVGDTLRKERVTRRITVETIAKDLKLNVKYIKALESNEYEGLPADPYVRVYLKSLAKYLSLDSDAILKRFYDERGMEIEKTPAETSTKVTISVKQKEESRNPMFIIAIVLIILLALFSIIAKKKGWLVTPPPASITTAMTPEDTEFTETERFVETDSLDDSLIPAIPPQPSDTNEEINLKSTDNQPVETTQLHLQLVVLTDSVWVQVFSDGISWRNILYKNQNRDFSANDSFNVHVGNIGGVKFTCNNKRITIPGKGVSAFKIDRSGKAFKWTLIKWNSIFSGRI